MMGLYFFASYAGEKYVCCSIDFEGVINHG